jgi:hypothetical protein
MHEPKTLEDMQSVFESKILGSAKIRPESLQKTISIFVEISILRNSESPPDCEQIQGRRIFHFGGRPEVSENLLQFGVIHEVSSDPGQVCSRRGQERVYDHRVTKQASQSIC